MFGSHQNTWLISFSCSSLKRRVSEAETCPDTEDTRPGGTNRVRTPDAGTVRQISQLDSDLGVAPLGDALPAEQVSTGRAGGVPPRLQTQDAASGVGVGVHRMLRTKDTWIKGTRRSEV